MIIKLLTNGGRGAAVLAPNIPSFISIPDVIMWGVRTFSLRPALMWQDRASPEYSECFAYTVVDIEGASTR